MILHAEEEEEREGEARSELGAIQRGYTGRGYTRINTTGQGAEDTDVCKRERVLGFL